MSFTISGFGARQIEAAPMPFQALSLDAAPPVAPAPPFGSPNNDLVAVRSAQGAAPLFSLSLQAAPAAAAIEAITTGAVPQAPAVSSPPVQSVPPLSTAFTGAQNPNVLVASGPSGSALGVQTPQVGGVPPEGLVALVPQNSAQPNEAALILPLPSPAPAQEAAGARNGQVQNGASIAQTGSRASSPNALPVTTQAQAIAKIVETVKQLAVSAVYPQPIFAFTA